MKRAPAVQTGWCLAGALCLACGAPLLLASGTAPDAADAPQLEQRFQELLQARRYELARKFAILQFRPDLHCETYLDEATAVSRDVEARVVEMEAAREVDPEELQRLGARLAEGRARADQAVALAEDYIIAGSDPALGTAMRQRRDEVLEALLAIAARLEALQLKAKALDTLIAQERIDRDDIANLQPEGKLIVGLHLADRGRFDEAVGECFIPVRLGAGGALEVAAKTASDILQKWHEQALENRKWTNLVEAALEAYDRLREAYPERPALAGWMICLGAHLARDHYDVSPNTIRQTIEALEELKLPRSDEPHLLLLQAKLNHERFLLLRRREDWQATPPPVRQFDLFQATHSRWYAAEAALIAAGLAAEPDAAEAWGQKARATVSEIRGFNDQLAATLDRRLRRFDAMRQPFGDWLELARQPDCQDTRGTVLPDVLIETRADLIARVRGGFERLIAEALQIGDAEAAFQYAQRAKALTVGRTLTAEGRNEPEPIASTALVRANLMNLSIGEDARISNKELFIEFFFGPARAWAFYLFAPGDLFQPLQVVELDRAAFVGQCRSAIEALRRNEMPQNVGGWLLSGRPDLAELWGQLERTKQLSRSMPRLVVAPDGPLNFLPLHLEGLDVAASVTYLPTAAVLRDARYLDARRDARLMWEAQRGDLVPEPVRTTRVGGTRYLVLWPGMEIPLVVKDAQ